jgi:hypothetical protein
MTTSLPRVEPRNEHMFVDSRRKFSVRTLAGGIVREVTDHGALCDAQIVSELR